MSDPVEDFGARYASAFHSYLFGAGEVELEAAYELGRAAVTGNLGLLDLAEIHHRVLADALREAQGPKEVDRVSRAGTDFFLESLGTFEMTQRGFREAQESAVLQREIAKSLQQRLLPDRLPELPGLHAAARYRAGGNGVEVGGDWYDLIPLSEHRVGVAIGDVVGRGVAAAATMGQLRVALRAYALENEDPTLVAQLLARFAYTLRDDQLTTCIYLMLDSATGEMRFTTVGHPPPLLLGSDGDARFLQGDAAPPLGVSSERGYSESRGTFDPGSTVLLYTDGLVERRGTALDEGLERLRMAVAGARLDPEALCDRVLSALVREAPSDDVALLAVRRL